MHGFDDKTEAHAWNYVYHPNEGKWYAVDTTWDNNRHKGREKTYNYFLVGNNTKINYESGSYSFLQTHKAGMKVFNRQTYTPSIPTISDDRYEKFSVTVSKSTTNKTNKPVRVVLDFNRKIEEIPQGWELSVNKTQMAKNYVENINEIFTITNLRGEEVKVQFSINNIDTKEPNITGVENGKTYNKLYTNYVFPRITDFDTVILTKNGVTVASYRNGQTISEEGTYKLTATDKAGNKKIVEFSIKYIRGELNENNRIETGDVLIILRYIAQSNSLKVSQKHPDWNLNEKKQIIADVNKNGKIDTGDVLKLQRYIAAKSSTKIAQKNPNWLKIE